ncbi:MAG: PAS domain-containing protein, partial [Candidatus Limnocylindrales bacterium]
MDVPRAPRARAAAPLGLSVEPVLDASPNPVVAVDGRGRIVYANPRVQDAFGWSADELRGEPIELLVPARLAERHVAHRGVWSDRRDRGALFAGDAGAVYALAPSRTAAEAVAAWGSPPPVRSVFPPTDCWALRRGRLHVVHDEEPELRCLHVEEPIASGLLCAPLSAQTETLGLLHVQVRRHVGAAARAALLANRERLLGTLGRQVALALANIRLRETLREQSSRDALTGLFNRRS